ncbi:hypothetical protein Q4Q35_09600 [Flavivirga aquimarina]|uniref:Uncharacterized protein n=1 Tax=Flavivirga aquimarina TaxID=2027862 RepID=A0ABT8WA90_9FLAO|nr:hypothetical protein [Flavivirga aquimarina]MDO5970063.1 hypothetical protein [Flavivirga aquimarina]
MKPITIIFFILFLNFSCSEKNENGELLKENSLLKTKISKLEKNNAELNKQNSILESLKSKSVENKITELRNSKVIKILDERFSKDTLDLLKYGNEYIFERNIELTKLDNVLFAETFGNIREQLNSFGYSVFSICDGESLPLEMCNCTDSIYIVIEPEELGEDCELYRVGFFYNVDLVSLERIKKEDFEYDFELTFEHGKYPRKKEKINLTKMKLEK